LSWSCANICRAEPSADSAALLWTFSSDAIKADSCFDHVKCQSECHIGTFKEKEIISFTLKNTNLPPGNLSFYDPMHHSSHMLPYDIW